MCRALPRESKYGNIRIPKTQLIKLKQVLDRHKHDLLDRGITSLSGMVQENLNDLIEADEKTMQYAPFLQESGIELDRYVVKDSKLDKHVDIYLRDKTLYCEVDRTANCVHTAFVWSQPAIYSALKSRGMKPK